MTTHHSTVLCSACGQTCVCTQQERLPDDGWILPFDLFGYYGGFSDEIDALIGNRVPRSWTLCHDCVVKFFETFPMLAEALGKGTHSCDRDEPCCEFAWRATQIFGQYEMDDEGKYTPKQGAHYQVVENGKWIDVIEVDE